MLYEVSFEFWRVPVTFTYIILSFTSILSGAAGLSWQTKEQAKVKIPKIIEITSGCAKKQQNFTDTLFFFLIIFYFSKMDPYSYGWVW